MTDDEFYERHPFAGDTVERLYRYQPYDPDRLQYLTCLLQDGLLHHSRPSTFNDPWEAKPAARSPATAKELQAARRRIEHIYQQQGQTQAQARRAATKTLTSPREFEVHLVQTMTHHFEQMSLCCLSSSKDHTLLWSHYARGHTGICVEFDANVLPVSAALQVQYQTGYPTITYPFDEAGKDLLDVLMTKSAVWSYESEYRMFNYIAGNRPPHYRDDDHAALDKSAVTVVILGSEMPQEHRDVVVQMVESGPFDPVLYVAKRNPTSYSLDFELLS